MATGKLKKKPGALGHVEAAGDGLSPKMGGMSIARFGQAAKAKPNQTVLFSFIIFKSRKHREQANARAMNDPAMKAEQWKDAPMPYDMRRMG